MPSNITDKGLRSELEGKLCLSQGKLRKMSIAENSGGKFGDQASQHAHKLIFGGAWELKPKENPL